MNVIYYGIPIGRWIGYSKRLLDVKEFGLGTLKWTSIPSRVYSCPMSHVNILTNIDFIKLGHEHI